MNCESILELVLELVELVSEPLDLKNQDWNRYQNRWISRNETGIGIGTVGSPEPRQESVSESLDLQNRDWNRYRNRWIFRTETGIGIGTVGSQEPRLESESISFTIHGLAGL